MSSRKHNFNIISVIINNDERNLSTLRWGDFAGHETVMHGTEEKKVSIQIDHNFLYLGIKVRMSKVNACSEVRRGPILHYIKGFFTPAPKSIIFLCMTHKNVAKIKNKH